MKESDAYCSLCHGKLTKLQRIGLALLKDFSEGNICTFNEAIIKYQIKPNTLKQIQRQFGVRFKKPFRISGAEIELMKELRRLNVSYKRIGDILGVTRQAVFDLLERRITEVN